MQEASKMQILPQKKQQKIVENLIQIDRDLQQINIDRNESSVRHLIDHRRQLLANLRSLQPDNETPESSPVGLNIYQPYFQLSLCKNGALVSLFSNLKSNHLKIRTFVTRFWTIYCQKPGILTLMSLWFLLHRRAQ